MSQSRELQQHINQLEDIRSILNAMKNLAFMAVHKLVRLQQLQSQVVSHISDSASVFLATYPEFINHSDHRSLMYIVVGSERGFCGDFNEQLLDSLVDKPCAGIIAIGSRLIARLESYSYSVIASLVGVNAEEEVPSLLEQLLVQLDKLAHDQVLIAVYHDYDNAQIHHQQILPAFTQLPTFTANYPPLLNLPANVFFSELLTQYLLAVWHEIFFSSLLTENRCRFQHLEAAVQHLDDHTQKLQRKARIYRQEEITEEIEEILLNIETV